MASNKSAAGVYEDLAQWYDHAGQAKQRDWFLVLAADEALARGHPADAERFRNRLLQNNPHHLLKPYASFQEALRSPDVQAYVADLRRTYPPETAANMLASQRKGTAGSAGQQPAPRSPSQPPGAEWFSPTAPEPVPFRVQPDASDKNRPAISGTRGPSRPEPVPRPAAQPVRPPHPPTSGRGPLPVPLPRPATRSTRRYEDPSPGGWLAMLLFLVLLLGGLALGAYVLASPFLPAGWLP